MGFESFAEFNAYVSFVMMGMSIMMVISAVTGAPSFITKYYEYATGIPGVECENPIFWKNANTFFNLGTYVTQLACEALTLLPVIRKIPLRFRLLVGLTVPFVEMLILILIPVFKIPTQTGAIVVLMMVAVLGGFSKALCDTSANALVGPFPTVFVNGEQWGLAISSLLMSILSVILKVSMGETFSEVNTQSRIYFGIAIGFQFLTIVQFLLLFRNPYAHQFIAEFRMLKGGAVEGESEPVGEADGVVQEGEDEDGVGMIVEKDLHPENSSGADEVRRANAAVLRAHGDADGMVDADQHGNMTSSEQMVKADLCTVIKKVYPMLFSTFFVFFVTMSLWPGVFFDTYGGDTNWFSTVIVLLFNTGDFLSRIVLMFPALRPSPMACLIGSVSRVLFIPLIVVCVRGLINSEALPYVLVLLFGLTNGYFGTMSMIYCPRTPTLSTAGERSMSGVVGGMFIQIGLALGSNFAAIINGVIIPNA